MKLKGEASLAALATLYSARNGCGETSTPLPLCRVWCSIEIIFIMYVYLKLTYQNFHLFNISAILSCRLNANKYINKNNTLFMS